MYAEAELISDAVKQKGLNAAWQKDTNLDDLAKSRVTQTSQLNSNNQNE